MGRARGGGVEGALWTLASGVQHLLGCSVGWGGAAAGPPRDTEYTLAAALADFYLTPGRPGGQGGAPEEGTYGGIRTSESEAEAEAPPPVGNIEMT